MTPDLATHWLGLRLRTPLVVGAAAPLSDDLDHLVQLEQAGAAAVVLYSLFEEDVEAEQLDLQHWSMAGSESYPEAIGYWPASSLHHGGVDLYLRHLERARQRLTIPVIASLNGITPGCWVTMARRLEDAGAAALELNVNVMPLDARLSSAAIETQVEEIVREVRAEVTLPLAVKLSPYYTNLTAMAARLADAGADGLVLFNRFYQLDLDIEQLTVRPNMLLSTSHDLRLPLRWIALLHGRQPLQFAGSGGVQRGTDVIRLLMAGACCTQLVAALLRHGPGRLTQIEHELQQWLEEHGYASLADLIGCLSQQRSPDPAHYERAQYRLMLQGAASWSSGQPWQ